MAILDLGKVTGDNGTSMRYRGLWANGVEYVNNEQYMDVVTHGGCLWICSTTNTDEAPSEASTSWHLAASGMDNGADVSNAIAHFTVPETYSEPETGQTIADTVGKLIRGIRDSKTTGGESGVLFGSTSTSAGYHTLANHYNSLTVDFPFNLYGTYDWVISKVINLQVICIRTEGLNSPNVTGSNQEVELDVVNIPIVNAAFMDYEGSNYELRKFYPSITRNYYPLSVTVNRNNTITIALEGTSSSASVAVFAVLYNSVSL